MALSKYASIVKTACSLSIFVLSKLSNLNCLVFLRDKRDYLYRPWQEDCTKTSDNVQCSTFGWGIKSGT